MSENRPPVEVGDWIQPDYLGNPESVDRPHHAQWWNDHPDHVLEIRKANGHVWRRVDRKET